MGEGACGSQEPILLYQPRDIVAEVRRTPPRNAIEDGEPCVTAGPLDRLLGPALNLYRWLRAGCQTISHPTVCELIAM